MDDAMNFIVTLILGLVGLVMEAVIVVEDALRDAMTSARIDPEVQSVVLIAVAVLVILAAYRLFGGLFGILITAFLLLLIIHILLPGLAANLQHA